MRMFDELLVPQDWTFLVPIACGLVRLSEIGAWCARPRLKRPLIVTDSGSSELPFMSDIQRFLAEAGLAAQVHSGIFPNTRRRS